MLALESHLQRLCGPVVETRYSASLLHREPRDAGRLKSSLLAVVAVTVLALALAACNAMTPTGGTSAMPPASAPAAAQSVNATVGAMQITDAWARPVQSGLTGAVYFTVRNSGNTPDRLVKAQSDIAKSVETHTTEMKDGVMSMRPVDGYDVPAGGELVLKPGGNHIMLVGMNKDVKADDTVTLKLQFEKAGPVDVTIKARNP